MKIRKAFKFRLRPKTDQREKFAQFAGCCRYTYNRGLDHRQKSWKEGEKVSYYDQTAVLAQWKCEEETSWLKGVHSQVLQQSLKDLDAAFGHFFRRVASGDEEPGYPSFKKKGQHDSFRYPQGVKTQDDRVYLPKIGWLRFRKSREIEGVLKQTTVIRDGDDWYVSFSCEIEVVDRQPAPISENMAVGIDVGVKIFAALAKGVDNAPEIILSPGFLPHLVKQIKNLQQHLSRKVKGSQNWQKCRRKLAKLHRKARNCRTDFIHKLSTKIVNSHDIICVEGLAVKEMLQNAHRSLSRAISDCAWRQFLACLKYKTKERGKRFVEADRYFASTQLCSGCRHKTQMNLGERTYSCSACGLSIDRDLNSAINIKAAGMSVLLNACGASA